MLGLNNQFDSYFTQNNQNINKEKGFNVLNAKETEILNPESKKRKTDVYIINNDKNISKKINQRYNLKDTEVIQIPNSTGVIAFSKQSANFLIILNYITFIIDIKLVN